MSPTTPVNEETTSAMNPELESVRPKIRVVIADDHPIVRDGLKKLLSLEEDIDVVGAVSDGRELIEKVDQLQPDVILLDLRMPNLDGLGAMQTLVHTNSKARVIILT